MWKNALLNLIKQQNDGDFNIIDKIYLYIQDSNEAKSQCLTKDIKKLILNAIKIQKLLLTI